MHMPAQFDVVQNRHVGKELNILKGSCNTQTSNPVGLEIGDIMTLEKYFSTLQLIKAVDTVQQAGLTGTVGPDNRKDLTMLHAGGDP